MRVWQVVLALAVALGLGAAVCGQNQKNVPLDNRTVVTGPLRVVIAGMVHGHVDGFLSQVAKREDVEIVGIAEPDRALFDQYAKKYGLDAKLYHAELADALAATEPEAVLIYTSTFAHSKTVEICAKYSKTSGAKPLTVMMEKPLAVSGAAAHAIQTMATEAKMTVLVNYFTMWEPSRQGVYDMAHTGKIGAIRKIVAHDGHKGPKEIGVGPEFLGWLTDPKLNGGGALYDFGCYGVDFITWLMDGQRPLTVTAVTLQIKPDVYPKVDDDATIVLTYAKSVGIVQGSWNWPFGRSDVEVYGKTGEVRTAGRDAMEVRGEGDGALKKWDVPKLQPPKDDELDYLRAVVREGYLTDGPGSLANNVVVAEVLDAARESARTGTTVKLNTRR